MYLYLYRSENKDKQPNRKEQEDHSGFSERLVRKVLSDYCGKQKLEMPEETLRETAIVRAEKGKPYFAELSAAGCKDSQMIHYSVSHSGSWWGCLMAEEPVGFDMEVCREKVNHEKIARRFFTEEECELILSAGQDAFFDVWVRKEAYVKYLGTGIAEGLDSFSVAENGKLLHQVVSKKEEGRDRKPCFIKSCEIFDGVKSAYCCGSGDQIKAIISL